jgi:GDPmannose 4,6-dehydratase
MCGMWMMLQKDEPGEYVLSTGKTNTVRELTLICLKLAGFDDVECVGTGVDEKIVDKKSGKVLVTIDPVFFRPAEVELLIGDPTKANKELGWKNKTDLEELCRIMYESDLQKLKEGKLK